MARNNAIWAIDIGQCALKALRCTAHDEDDSKIVAEAFDYIEYPKILSQAGADPGDLIGDALKQFLSRNTLRGDRVAISVPGQSGLARFIKLPPVEAKKIPDIIRYEARQQIPFDLNDVIWDYQRMGGGSEEEGFALETEIGLFAMKREAVFRTLEPFQKAGIEIDFVQLTPLALYNYVLFDQLENLPPADEYDPENPPPSVVILSLGTDATDLVVTNGFRVWQRSIPLGGNHFTKALTKELKLTFAKAEHLKRNAAAAQDPKAVFQAMRPVFNDLLTELQRSIGYFTSLDRAAEISHILALGNAMKLQGLRRYLAQSLGYDVRRVDQLRGLAGSQVISAPAFKDNVMSFGVCYGLALQGLGKSGLQTNLLPKEIVHDRLVRQKKPWAIATAAVLLLACGISFATYSFALSGVDEKKPQWQSAESKVSQVANLARGFVSDFGEAETKLKETEIICNNLVGNVENRILWLELLRALNWCLPYEKPTPRDQEPPPIEHRNELHITNIECAKVQDLAAWYKSAEPWHPQQEAAEGAAGAEAPGDGTTGGTATAGDAATEETGPSGKGWVIMITGYHYRNPLIPKAGELHGPEFVRQTLMRDLQNERVELPTADRKDKEDVSMKDLGIGYPVLIDPKGVYEFDVTTKRASSGTGGNGAGGYAGRSTKATTRSLRRFDFLVQFCWKQIRPSKREKKAKEAESDEVSE